MQARPKNVVEREPHKGWRKTFQLSQRAKWQACARFVPLPHLLISRAICTCLTCNVTSPVQNVSFRSSSVRRETSVVTPMANANRWS